MIPELGIVPPVSEAVYNSSNHLRKKSYNGADLSNGSLNREIMNPTVARFDKNLNGLKTLSNAKPATANEASFNEYNSPNFMPNINQKVSSTMYKVSQFE